MNRFKEAFSLIELMIVITIIGILAAVAVPAYNTYTIKAKLAEPIGILRSHLQASVESRQVNGSWPTGIASVPGGLITGANTGSSLIDYIHYGASTNLAYVCAGVSGEVGIPTWVTSGNVVNGGTHNRMCFIGHSDANGVITFKCGAYNGDPKDIPLTYLPGGCNDPDAIS